MTDAEAGARLLDPEHAMRALGQVLDRDEPLVTVADVDWPRFAAAFTVRRPSPLIAALPDVRNALAVTAGHGVAVPGAGTALGQRLAPLPSAERSTDSKGPGSWYRSE